MAEKPKRLDLDADAKSRGLTRKGRDLILARYKPIRFTGIFPVKTTAATISDVAEVGLTYWGEAPGTGYRWATDCKQRYHAVHSTTRKGQRQSRHACGLMREYLANEINRLTTTAYWQLSGFEREDWYRDREITRLQLALSTPSWQCEADGPIFFHPPVSAAAVEAIVLGAGDE